MITAAEALEKTILLSTVSIDNQISRAFCQGLTVTDVRAPSDERVRKAVIHALSDAGYATHDGPHEGWITIRW